MECKCVPVKSMSVTAYVLVYNYIPIYVTLTITLYVGVSTTRGSSRECDCHQQPQLWTCVGGQQWGQAHPDQQPQHGGDAADGGQGLGQRTIPTVPRFVSHVCIYWCALCCM